MTQQIKTAVQRADGVTDFLSVKALGWVMDRIPVKYKTLTGTAIVSLTLLFTELCNTFGWFADTTLDESICNVLYASGSLLAGVGIVHKNRKADPPPTPMNPIGTAGSNGQAKGQ